MNDGFAASMSDIFDDLFGDIMGRRGGRGGSGKERGADLRYNLEDHARGSLSRQERDDQAADLGDLRRLRRRRREGGLEAGDLQDLRRPRPRSRPAGILRHRADLPDLRRPRPDDRQPLRKVRRRRPRHARAHAFGQRAGGRRGRHAHPPIGRGRGGLARRRPPAISTSSCRSSRIRSSSATAPTSIAACRSRWCRRRSAANSRCARSTAATPRCASPRARNRDIRCSLRGKGMPVLRSRDFGDLYIQAIVETPQNLTRRQRELLSGIRGRIVAQDPSREHGLLRQDERILRRSELARPAAARTRRALDASRGDDGSFFAEDLFRTHGPAPSGGCSATRRISSRPCSSARA